MAEKGQVCSSNTSSRGLQFYTFFGISKGIKLGMVDIAKILYFYFRKNA